MNVQYAIFDNTVYVLEANPRASRTVPIVSKVCGISMARLATQVMLGKKLADLNLQHRIIPHYGVKGSGVSRSTCSRKSIPVLGPEMRSTGEVLGISHSYGRAFFKAQEATQVTLPLEGTVLFTIADRDKTAALEPVRLFRDLGFRIMTTRGTHAFLRAERDRDRTGPETGLRPTGSGGRHQERRSPAAGQHPERTPEHRTTARRSAKPPSSTRSPTSPRRPRPSRPPKALPPDGRALPRCGRCRSITTISGSAERNRPCPA